MNKITDNSILFSKLEDCLNANDKHIDISTYLQNISDEFKNLYKQDALLFFSKMLNLNNLNIIQFLGNINLSFWDMFLALSNEYSINIQINESCEIICIWDNFLERIFKQNKGFDILFKKTNINILVKNTLNSFYKIITNIYHKFDKSKSRNINS